MYPQEESNNELIVKYFPGKSIDYDTTISSSFTQNTNTNRGILIEDYTGHLCNNCPPAAVIAHDLEINNPGVVHVLSVHSGGGANTFQSVTGVFETNYTTPEGTDYADNIQNGIPANPYGMISRSIPPSTSNAWISKDSWGTQVSELINSNELKANIQMQAEFYPSTKGIFVHYEVEALEDFPANTKFLILVAEHKVISPQKLEDSSTDMEYEHHNVLSGKLSKGNYGDAISTTGLLAGEKSHGLLVNGLEVINTNRVVNSDNENDLVIFGILLNPDTDEIYHVVTQDVEIDKQL